MHNPTQTWITTGYGTLAESLKCEYFKTPCLGGLREVTLIHQFQSRKTVTFRTTLFMLIPVLLCGIWLPLQYSNMHNDNLLSTSISLQRHNIHAKFIRFPCAHINSFTYAKNQKLLYTLLRIFTAVTGWLYFLILLAGDIELNPGSYSPDTSLSSDSSGSHMDVSVFESNFSVVHYNVQSLLNKIDLLQVELSHFDVIAMSETWLSQSIDDTDLKLLNYQSPFRKDRQTNNYGGVIVYVRDNIPCKRRPDLEVQGLESLWLELRLKSKVVLFGTFYRPPDSSNEILDKIEESIDLSLDNDVADVMVTGDFNLNFLDNANRAKIMSVFDQYSLYQLINEPTHSTETSSTLIDLLFTRNPENIIISGAGDAFLDQNLRYHCPTYAVFNFDKPKYQCYKRKIWKYDDGDYGQLRQLIQEFNLQSLKNEDINVYAENVTNKILELCELAIPNKTITVRPTDPPWVSGHIRRLIRRRKRAHRKAKRLDTPESWRKFRKLRNEASKAIKSAKQDLKDNISSKDWWKTFKCLIEKDKTDPIPPLNHNGKQINDPTEKANAFNKYFHLQSQLDDRNKPVPNLAPPSNFLSSITVQKEEVCVILKSLATGKACGPDQISNSPQRSSWSYFRTYRWPI